MLHNAMVATRFLMDDAVCLSGVDWLKTAMSFRLWLWIVASRFQVLSVNIFVSGSGLWLRDSKYLV
jgi:hypothetical protein